MQFKKKARHAPREITSRQVKAYERACRRKQDALPLFAESIAAAQLPADTEMARRQAADAIFERARRNDRAADWRRVRARLFALPAYARAAVLDRYNGNKWFPRDPSFLACLVWDSLKPVTVDAADVVRPAEAQAMIAELNDRARRQDTFTRRRFCYSPGVMAWLCPDFTPDEDHARPRLHLHTPRGWLCGIDERVFDYADFSHNSDPSGERRSGSFEFLGVWFRFEIHYVSHADNTPSVAPWNIDLSRRIVWVGLENEAVDLSVATFSGGWRPESSAVDCQSL